MEHWLIAGWMDCLLQKVKGSLLLLVAVPWSGDRKTEMTSTVLLLGVVTSILSTSGTIYMASGGMQIDATSETHCHRWFGLVWFGLVWCGVVWFGLAWFGLAWFGLVWFGLVWFGLVWLVGWLVGWLMVVCCCQCHCCHL
jgi:hypothetical protein